MTKQSMRPQLKSLLSQAKHLVSQVHSLGLANTEQEVGQLRIDSRVVEAQDIFIALPGEHRDGHEFVTAIIAQKPACVVVHESWNGLQALLKQKPETVIVVVSDQVAAMAAFAEAYREHCRATPFIAVTGSVGKTTVKTLLSHALEQFTPTLATFKSQNNHLGVPMTLSRLTADIEVGVAELGANHLGEIAQGAGIVKPTVSVLTGVNSAHIEGFGSLENTAQAKGEILDALVTNGCAVLNRDDVFYPVWKKRLRPDVLEISFGLSAEADIQVLGGGQLRLHESLASKSIASTAAIQLPVDVSLKMPLLGQHNQFNAAIAVAAVIGLGIVESPAWFANFYAQLPRVFATVRPAPGRLEPWVLSNQTLLIDDSYNASPVAVLGSIEALVEDEKSQQGLGECWFVFGDMAELGQESTELHQQVGEKAAALGVDQFWAFGEQSSQAAEVYAQHKKAPIACFQSKEALNAALTAALQVSNPARILVKGARSSRMELVVDHLKKAVGLKQEGKR